MSLVRKRKSSSRKGCPAKCLRTGKSEFTGLPESHNASSLLGAETRMITTTSQEKKGLEVHGSVSSWRRSQRFKGHGLLSQVPSTDLVAVDQSPGEIQGEEQVAQCSSQQSPQREDDTDTDLVITMDDRQCRGRKSIRKKGGVKRKKRLTEGAVGDGDEDEMLPEVEIDRELDRELENKSKQHNLTTTNVRNIIHEVITNEHVVAMMKAAINETEAVPVFEPKMTRSKFKEVVEKGAVIPTWNISPIKKVNKEKAQQFVDIQLAEEDSSDEEYRPNEDEDDETAEDTFQESDIESTASSPRVSRLAFARGFHTEKDDDQSRSPMQVQRNRSRHLRVEAVPMGPPPPPQPSPVSKGSTSRAPPDCSFLEKLHAVEEELAIGPVCLEPYQPALADGLMACRTRSKRPLRDVPMGQLEAELRAPDITPDMYDCGSVSEDPEWTNWLQGIMTSDVDNEEEADDDEDDPEYNFLAEIDEPDLEDYRNDRAVRITKKEVNQLMEELFETFQDELTSQELEEDGHEEEEEREEEASVVETPTVNTPPAILETLEDPIAEGTAGRRLTVKEQLAAIRRRRALLVSQGLLPPESLVSKPREPPPPFNPTLSHCQWLKLQQQVQQHVQLLTQVHMLTSPVSSLQSEAATTQQFLAELQMFAERGELSRCSVEPGFTSVFRACNLQGALSLVEELRLAPIAYHPPNVPRKSKRYQVRRHPTMPPQLAWMFATRPVFLYPELLPVVSLDPALFTLRFFSIFTDAEECLAVLGLRNMADTLQPKQLACQYLLRAKRVSQLVSHVIEKCKPVQPHNVFKAYHHHGVVQPMPLACGRVMPGDLRPPVEREEEAMPDWLRRSLPYIYQAIKNLNTSPDADARSTCELNDAPRPSSSSRTPEYSFPARTRYPPQLPNSLTFQRCGFRRRNPEASCALSLSLAVSHHTSCSPEDEVARSLNNTQTRAALQKCMANHKLNPIQPAKSTPLPPPAIPLQIILTLPTKAVIYPAPTAITLTSPSPISAPLAKDLVIQQFSMFANLRQLPRQLPTLPHSDESLSLTNLHTLAPNTSGKTSSTYTKTNSFVSTETPIDPSDDQSSRSSRRKPKSDVGSEKPPPDSREPPVLDRPLTPNDYVAVIVEEVVKEEMENEQWGREAEERGGGDFGMPALALSESSASPSGSIDHTEWPEEGQEITLTLSPGPSDMGDEEGVEVMSPASEESTLSVPELQETMKKLSWLASGGRSEDSESEQSGTPTGCHSCIPTPASSRQIQHPIGETCSEDTPRSPTVLYDDDDDLLDCDPLKEKKEIAFAQNYLNRVCEALQEVPGRVEEFLKVLYEFKQDTDQRTSVELFMRLKPVLSEWPELLRDFAAFLHPEQAQECGLLAEQQAFERSRRFLRQLEQSFGDDSSHYLKIVRILQEGSDVSPAGIKEMKSQIATLLQGHTHLQGEFWVFFNELHPQPSLQCPTKARKCYDATNTKTISQKSSVEKEMKEFKGPKTLQAKQVTKSLNAQSNISEHPVCAKNISLTPSGEKVILWTREADRAILTACKQKGANKSTFQAISIQLGNKTANEVCVRFQELVHLFHSSTQRKSTDQVSDAEPPTSSRKPDPD